MQSEMLGTEHPEFAASLSNLAVLYRAMGRYSEASELYQRSLTISRKALGPEHPDVAINLNNLAVLYRRMGRTSEAASIGRDALAILERTLGPDNPSTREVRENLEATLKG
jgi:tetratricopeptide (TPR) repeat protein